MTNDMRRGCVVLFAMFFLVGCAGSGESVNVSYDRSSGTTKYETSEMRLDDIEMGSGLETEDRFYVQIAGTCTGNDCAPSQYSLRFIKGGQRGVTVEGRDVTLTVGSETLRWRDAMTRETTQTSTIRSGAFAKVSVSSKQLSTIGGASTVKGTVCGERFTLPYRTRAPIRTLLSRLEDQSSGTSDEGSADPR